MAKKEGGGGSVHRDRRDGRFVPKHSDKSPHVERSSPVKQGKPGDPPPTRKGK